MHREQQCHLNEPKKNLLLNDKCLESVLTNRVRAWQIYSQPINHFQLNLEEKVI